MAKALTPRQRKCAIAGALVAIAFVLRPSSTTVESLSVQAPLPSQFAKSLPIARSSPAVTVLATPEVAADSQPAVDTPPLWSHPAGFARRSEPITTDRLRVDDPDALQDQLRDAMPQVMPSLQDCYAHSRSEIGSAMIQIEVTLTLTRDRDIGTMIEADVHKHLHRETPPPFVICMRSVLALLELPPIAEGVQAQVVYAFSFGSD